MPDNICIALSALEILVAFANREICRQFYIAAPLGKVCVKRNDDPLHQQSLGTQAAGKLNDVMAEAQGFEPWIPEGMLVFKTSAIDRSAKPPEIMVELDGIEPSTSCVPRKRSPN